MTDRLISTVSKPSSVVLLLLCVVVASPDLLAQPSEDGEQTATELYERAVEAYGANDYEKAAELFRRAYRKRPNAVLKYNVAMAEWRLGHLDEARDAMDQALEMGLDGQLLVKARSRSSGFETHAGAKSVATQIAEARAREVEKRLDEPETSKPTSRWRRGLLFGGMSAAVVGLGSIATAIVMDRQVNTLAEELDSSPPPPIDRQRELYSDLETRQNLGRAFLLGGTVAAVAGGTMLLFSKRRSSDVRPSDERDAAGDGPEVRVSVAGDRASLLLRLQF